MSKGVEMGRGVFWEIKSRVVLGSKQMNYWFKFALINKEFLNVIYLKEILISKQPMFSSCDQFCNTDHTKATTLKYSQPVTYRVNFIRKS